MSITIKTIITGTFNRSYANRYFIGFYKNVMYIIDNQNEAPRRFHCPILFDKTP